MHNKLEKLQVTICHSLPGTNITKSGLQSNFMHLVRVNSATTCQDHLYPHSVWRFPSAQTFQSTSAVEHVGCLSLNTLFQYFWNIYFPNLTLSTAGTVRQHAKSKINIRTAEQTAVDLAIWALAPTVWDGPGILYRASNLHKSIRC